MKFYITFFMALALLIATTLAGNAQNDLLLREQKTVRVNGIDEIWQLRWAAPPEKACSPQDPEAITCPCMPFKYGEAGDLYLARLRDGKEVERLGLTQYFQDAPVDGKAILRHWPESKSDNAKMADGFFDTETPASEKMLEKIYRRTPIDVMRFADYDHDGNATEFYIPAGEAPCGHESGFVVGVSADKPNLHVFSSVAHPDKPLYLETDEWAALMSGKHNVVDITCGDHGSEEEVDLMLGAAKGKISVTERYYLCTQKDKRGKLNESEVR